MPGPFRERIFGVLLKIETTPLTDAAPSNTVDGLQVVGVPTLTWDFLEDGKRDDVVTGQKGRAGRTAPAGRWGKLDVVCEVRGAGAAYAIGSVVPETDVLLRIGGFGRTFVATGGSESVLYRTIDQPAETATLWCYSAGQLFKLVGCVATLKFSAAAAKRGLINATITGVMTADPTQAALPVITYSSQLPPLFHTAETTIGSWSSTTSPDAMQLLDVEWDLGNVVTDLNSAGAADGHAGYYISDGVTRQSMTIRVPDIATFNAAALAKAVGSSLPLTTYALGTAQYKRAKMRTGRWELEKPGIGAASGLNTYKLSGNLVIGESPTASRELEILFD